MSEFEHSGYGSLRTYTNWPENDFLIGPQILVSYEGIFPVSRDSLLGVKHIGLKDKDTFKTHYLLVYFEMQLVEFAKTEIAALSF